MIPCLLGITAWLVKAADWFSESGCVSECCVNHVMIVDTLDRLERLRSKSFSHQGRRRWL